MRNRAKCKLCGYVIESFTIKDFVSCHCGEISIDGGSEYYKAFAKDFNNFLRVDDEGNEIIVTVKEKEDIIAAKVPCEGISDIQKPTRIELIDMLDEMAKAIERLPPGAMLQPITHYDHASLILLLSSILRAS
jgi:hypothetical protein